MPFLRLEVGCALCRFKGAVDAIGFCDWPIDMNPWMVVALFDLNGLICEFLEIGISRETVAILGHGPIPIWRNTNLSDRF